MIASRARHQIRAHLWSAGHALVGDGVYGGAGEGGVLYLHHYRIVLRSLDFAARAWPGWPEWETWAGEVAPGVLEG